VSDTCLCLTLTHVVTINFSKIIIVSHVCCRCLYQCLIDDRNQLSIFGNDEKYTVKFNQGYSMVELQCIDGKYNAENYEDNRHFENMQFTNAVIPPLLFSSFPHIYPTITINLSTTTYYFTFFFVQVWEFDQAHQRWLPVV
jgi:hypothetical protein